MSNTKPAAPAAAKVAEAPAPCRCGCGQPTVRPEARYVSGHDARHAGVVGREAAKLDGDKWIAKIEAVFPVKTDPKLNAKAAGVVQTARKREADKVARAAARAAAKEAAAKVLAAAGF